MGDGRWEGEEGAGRGEGGAKMGGGMFGMCKDACVPTPVFHLPPPISPLPPLLNPKLTNTSL